MDSVILPPAFSIVETVNRVRYIEIMRTVQLLDPVARVREAFAAYWASRLLR